MVRTWLRSHLSLVISATSGAVIAALVAAVAIVSTGYTAQRVDLGDGAVWVANSQQQAIGRANPDVLELNTVVASTSSDVDVLQSGQTVLLFDRADPRGATPIEAWTAYRSTPRSSPGRSSARGLLADGSRISTRTSQPTQ